MKLDKHGYPIYDYGYTIYQNYTGVVSQMQNNRGKVSLQHVPKWWFIQLPKPMVEFAEGWVEG